MEKLFSVEIVPNNGTTFHYVNFRYSFEVVNYIREYFPEALRPDLNALAEDLYNNSRSLILIETDYRLNITYR